MKAFSGKIETAKLQRRIYGQHLTSEKIFRECILPEIAYRLQNHIWVDLFAGEGNLTLPIPEYIPSGQAIYDDI